MKKKNLLHTITLCFALCVCSFVKADTERGLAIDSVVNTTSTQQYTKDEIVKEVLAVLPKFSGYVQTGYNWGDKNGDNRSSFQMKRMRLIVDKKISPMFDFRAQFEVFSNSPDGSAHKKKVMTIMDAYVNTHINKALHFRVGQYFLPLNFENYDISPATSETIDFSNITYRMVCRNAVSTPDLIDYGRDIGVMAYGDLLENKEQGFSYLSYNLSVTNGYLPTLMDDNKSKDVIGRLTFRPISKFQIIGAYNWGEYQRLGNTPVETKKYLGMDRYIVGAWYNDLNGLTLRSEYGHIKSSKANVKEDGLYVLAGYRINKFLPVVRWDMYRDRKNKTAATNKDDFLVGCSYNVLKSVKFQAAYTHSIYTDKVKDAGVRSGSGNSIQLMLLAHF